MTENKKWTIDRAVRIDFILALLVQLVVGVSYIASMKEDLKNTSQSLQEVKMQVQNVPERLTRVETNMDNTIDIVKDIRDKLWSNSAQAKTMR